ncbi:thiamine diphosphokinase [Treponema bryantii]|uniref:thiamine diphosphokinase n=1 Tax=Treponema bryantii TaxID=163 RepID=UPI0003B35E1C|nr:thiamine diphosphokinase [Treponema bryantii]
MKRCLIISAGEIRDYERVKSFLQPDDFFIFCDGGLIHADGLGLKPDLIVGDFDSCDSETLARWKDSCETVRLPREKDDTDTLFAVKLALERGYSDFLLLGAMGGRFDHAMGNVSILLYLHGLGKRALLVDDYSQMQIVGKEPFFIKDNCSYFSVLTVAGDVSGVTIKNAKYPLENAKLSADFQLGISNEVLPGKVAEVSVEQGKLLVVTVVE